MSAHYVPTPGPNGTWGFSTPSGTADGFWSESEALYAAARTLEQDRTIAETGNSPFAPTLKAYFASQEVPA